MRPRALTRRSFFVGATSAAAASRVLGANDQINAGFVGLGARGAYLLSRCAALGKVGLTAVCDVNQSAIDRARERAPQAKAVQDLRRLLEQRDVDVVLIATPNHWHALATIWSCQAGKDVFVENPASHGVREGARMAEAVAKYNRVVQVGMQWRSTPHVIEAVNLLRSGVIGSVWLAKAVMLRSISPVGNTNIGPVPNGLDWDLFLGPAAVRPYSQFLHANWRSTWDLGDAMIGDAGLHLLDVCLWGAGSTEMPTGVACSGNRASTPEQETPVAQVANVRCGSVELAFDGRVPGITDKPSSVYGSLFLGSEGRMWIDGRGYRVNREGRAVQEGTAQKVDGTEAHLRNFLDCVRARTKPPCDIVTGTRAATLAHLSNIAYRTGRQQFWDDSRQRFSNDAEANKLLDRTYRRPYVVPEKV